MKRPLAILGLSGALALGAFAGYQFGEQRPAAPLATPSASTGQMVPTVAAPAQAATPAFNASRARTESELNTVQVVKERQAGLVLISVEGRTASSELRRRLQEQLPFDLPDGQPDGSQHDNSQPSGTGSGFFINAQGDIITNNHVVEDAQDITIRLHGSQKSYPAKVIARAPDFDLALIRAEGLSAAQVTPLPLGDSAGLDVGLKAIAMGAPFGLDFSVSEGIISSLERRVAVGTKGALQSVIQTDAAINPGNSGGPLLDSAGQVIGVNTQILTGGISQSAGVGFAIPVNTVRELLPKLQAGQAGRPVVVQTPSLGISFADVSALPDAERTRQRLPESGAVVTVVYPDSPAARAGLRGGTVSRAADGSLEIANDGDVIVRVDGRALTDSGALPAAILGRKIGDTVTLTVRRQGQTREVRVKLAAFDVAAAAKAYNPVPAQ